MFDFRKVNDYMQIFGNDYSLRFFVLPFFQKKEKLKNKVRIKTIFLLMMENTRSKKPFINSTFVLGGTKGIFFFKR